MQFTLNTIVIVYISMVEYILACLDISITSVYGVSQLVSDFIIY